MIRRFWSSTNLVLTLLIALPMACLAQAPMAVTVPGPGPVQGLEANGVNTFRDIPFAAPLSFLVAMESCWLAWYSMRLSRPKEILTRFSVSQRL